MASLQFKIRNKSKTIHYRFTNGRKGLSFSKSTKFKLNQDDSWDSRKNLSKSNLELNKELLNFKAYILDAVNKAVIERLSINKILLNNLHENYFNPPKNKVKEEPTLLEYISVFQKSYDTYSTVKKLDALIKKVSDEPIIKLKDVDINWLDSYAKKMKTNNYAESSINKDCQLIKQIIRHAENSGLSIKRNVFNHKTLKTSTITHYLNEQELERVFNFKISNKALENTRRLFLIGCTTGLRISDLMKIKSFNMSNDMIELITTKTKQNIVIPINPRVKDFIADVQPLSYPVFNRNLKELFKLIGFDEVVEGYTRTGGENNKRVLGMYPKHTVLSSHAMRRSFATNLYGRLPTMVIMAITGHTTEKSFLTYIKKPQRDFAERLKEYYLEKDAGERRIA